MSYAKVQQSESVSFNFVNLRVLPEHERFWDHQQCSHYNRKKVRYLTIKIKNLFAIYYFERVTELNKRRQLLELLMLNLKLYFLNIKLVTPIQSYYFDTDENCKMFVEFFSEDNTLFFFRTFYFFFNLFIGLLTAKTYKTQTGTKIKF